MKKKTQACLALVTLLAVGVALVGCSGGELDSILGGGSNLLVPLTPKFLIAVDYDTTGTNVNVFPITASTGALGAPVAGSPFDMGITQGMTIAVHPNGHWVYAADGNDGAIHQWDVNTTTGVPTDIAPAVINEGGTFYQPNTPETTHVLAITPNGKFLYASNADSMVSAYSIGSNGALTHISDLDVGACSTGAITANASFVWVTDTCGSSGPWHVMTMKIGSNGSLTTGSTATLTGVFSWLWSISVSPDGKFVQVGDEGGDAQVYSFTVGTDGTLTQVGPQVILNSSSDCREIVYRPDSKFFYATDDDDVIHALQQNPDGSFTELAASPYNSGDGQIAMDLRGMFLYVGNNTSVDLFTIDSTTGALTFVSTTTTANDAAAPVGIVRVSP